MKRNLLLYILLTIQCMLNAQDVITYDGSFTGSGSIKACEGFVLKPGFSFTATGSRNLSLVVDESICSAYTEDKNNIGYSTSYTIKVIPTTETDKVNITENKIEVKRGAKYNATVQYFDGLARPAQTLQMGFTPLGNDLIDLTEYDGFGRTNKRWIPISYPANNGAFISYSGFQQEAEYYNAKPYTEIIYDNSSLNIIKGNKNPGTPWHENPTRVSYETNTAGMYVKCFIINSQGRLAQDGFYSAQSLQKTISTDEDGKSLIEFKDKSGRVIMIRQDENDDTYYVYDHFGNLRYVLPPLAHSTLTAAEYEDNMPELTQYAYIYKYDARKRCVQKRLPGCDWIYMAYDKADRLILSQDGNQRNNKQWTINKYDVFGRLLYTGIINREITVAEKNSIINSYTVEKIAPANYKNQLEGYTCDWFYGEISPLTVNYYNTYDFLDLSTYSSYKSTLTYEKKIRLRH